MMIAIVPAACGGSHEFRFTWTETFSWATFTSTAHSYWAISETKTNVLIAFDSAEKIFECLFLQSSGFIATSVELGEKIICTAVHATMADFNAW
jgi:hypothetical protein